VLLGFQSPNPHRSLASIIQLPDHMTVPGHPQVMSLNMFWYVEGPSVVAPLGLVREQVFDLV
jgi:hypothetical protein